MGVGLVKGGLAWGGFRVGQEMVMVCLGLVWFVVGLGRRHVCSAGRVPWSGCASHLAGVCAVLSRCSCAGVLTIWHACAVLSGCP